MSNIKVKDFLEECRHNKKLFYYSNKYDEFYRSIKGRKDIKIPFNTLENFIPHYLNLGNIFPDDISELEKLLAKCEIFFRI